MVTDEAMGVREQWGECAEDLAASAVKWREREWEARASCQAYSALRPGRTQTQCVVEEWFVLRIYKINLLVSRLVSEPGPQLHLDATC